ncbi:MAG: dTDP-4-dehydrorhamnose reductase, partial [Candidatus Omnitrophica bacterium]|nr:dTDP-4-dehydrorhamnose reductase [Candidatus Omnitrophota bacterium]
MDKKRVLVTGSNGMLGMDMVSFIGDLYDVYRTDLEEKKNFRHDGKRFSKCDITDGPTTIRMIKEAKPEVIIHTAAWTDVDGCELDQEKTMKINAEGTHNVALGAKEVNSILIYISSDFVFDGDKTSPYKEDDMPHPVNTYGLSKLKGETFIRKELDKYFIVRTSWLFGKYGKNFVDIVLDKAERKEELKIVVDQFGSPTYTLDLCNALIKLMAVPTEGHTAGGVYHFSNSGSCSWYKYAEEILRLG